MPYLLSFVGAVHNGCLIQCCINTGNTGQVNDHVVSVAGTEQCVLYDTEQQKPLKTLSYDYCSAGFFSVKDQFIVYGNEIKYCLNKETLEEQEPEAGLKKFVQQ